MIFGLVADMVPQLVLHLSHVHVLLKIHEVDDHWLLLLLEGIRLISVHEYGIGVILIHLREHVEWVWLVIWLFEVDVKIIILANVIEIRLVELVLLNFFDSFKVSIEPNKLLMF
jgi:hypothetical protein